MRNNLFKYFLIKTKLFLSPIIPKTKTPMKIKLILSVTILLFFVNSKAQTWIQLYNGEPGPVTTSDFYQYTGPSNNYVTWCNFDACKGEVQFEAEAMKCGDKTISKILLQFYYDGSYHPVFAVHENSTYTTSVGWSNSGCGLPCNSSYYGSQTTSGMAGTSYKFAEINACFISRQFYIGSYSLLNVYNGNYPPQLSSNNLFASNYNIQTTSCTSPHSLYGKFYTVLNGTEVENINAGAGVNQVFGLRFSVQNLPPEMISSQNGFKVRAYLEYDTGVKRVYEWSFANSSINAPFSLTATKTNCNNIVLNWSEPNQSFASCTGSTIKNVIYKNGVYLATVSSGVTTYTDAAALVVGQNYDYKVKQIRIYPSGSTYQQSSFSNIATGSLLVQPDQPLSPTATTNKCNNKIDLAWAFNGTNPARFKIDYSLTPAGTYSTLTSTITGTDRSYSHNSVIRGQDYYYKIYSINTCSVLSVAAAQCNGISPADPAIPTSVTAVSNTLTNSIDLTWQDNANNETKYQVVRTDDVGNTILTDLNPNQTSYSDASAAACRLYTYKVRVFNDCVLSGLLSTSQATMTLPPPNLGNTFTAVKKLTASKGYFSNRVELQWSNNNGLNIDLFKIYRKQLGTALDSVQITSLGSGNALYIDNTADARVFYRYTIVGVKQCNGSDLLTNISSDIGFRNPTGLVSGHIEYNGGIAVGGAKIFIQQSGALGGNSLDFDNNGTLTVNDASTLEPGAQLRMEFWLNPTTVAAGDIVSKGTAFGFSHNGSNWVASINTGATTSLTIPTASISLGNWNHVAVIYNGSALKAFVNGVITASASATGTITDNANNLVFGSPTSDFFIDEFRLIGQAEADSVISVESNRILNGDETNFKCNLHFNEAVGNFAYDVSKVGTFFNGNHGSISSNVSWSSNKPTSSQLGYFGVTNALGNYIATGIQYLGTGENFNLVPSYATHSFSPNSRSVYIGDGSFVYNNQDFIDNSSFLVTGTLFYKNTTCPVPNAALKIDGLQVIKNGSPVLTDANGTFSVSVPIGAHFVEVEKYSHSMEAGRYPTTGVHNFQAPISGVTFIDSTLVKIVGRVVGGKIEQDKAPGLGRSKNNIGRAKIILATPLTGTPCFTTSVITNSLTGEYVFNVPPMDYKVVDAYVLTNSVVIGKNQLSNTNNIVSLTNTFLQPTTIDTLKDNLGGIVSIDSVKFHKRLDFIYRNTPKVDVRNGDKSILHGEDTLYLAGSKIAIRPVATNTTTLGNYGWGNLNWPIFKQGKTYSFNVFANEIYTNNDNGLKDTVLLSGSVSITNEMVDGNDPNANFSFINGVGTYSFNCGQPNLSTIPGLPDISYTKNIQIAVIPDGAATIYWEPNTVITPSNKHYHAYVYGQRVTGTGISTQGPEKVDFILRDPPGSGSSSTWATGNSVTKSTSISTNFSSSTGLETSLLVGKSAHVGLGYAESIEVDNNVTLGLNVSTSFDTEKSMTETISSSFAVSTRDDADNVGATADIFIGRARNWLMGPTGSIEMIDVAKCSGRCFGPIISGKQMAKTTGFAISPDGVKTRFSYTQSEIETVVIPTLEALRNTILTSRPYYSIVAPSTHSLYASNNDDPLWGVSATSTNPAIYEDADTLGQSYIFKGLRQYKTDTVRLLNSQIALWKKTLGQNEREKYLAKFSTSTPTVVTNPNFQNPFTDSPTITIYPPLLQDNFTLGSAIITNAYQVDNEDSYSESYEVAVDESLAGQIGADLGGLGFQFNPHVSFTQGNTKGSSTTNTSFNSMEYTLTDGDPGDVMSVDVYRYGLSNIFVTRGGQTMCPYEDAVVCHYWDPAFPNKWISSHNYNETGYHTLSNATVQREMPNISITPAVQFNIPSNQPAVYQLILNNQSPLTVNNDIDLQVRIASVSNPNGAVCKIDGQNANDIFNIPSGGSVVKTLTIERGPIEINYDSLMVIFSSACSEDIADTAYVSVHFIPTCTDLEITAPANNFIINNFNNDISNITIENYNYNYGVAQNTSTVTGIAHPEFGFEKIGFEFKPSNSSTWLQIEEFYKSPAVAIAAGASTLYPIPNGQVYTPYTWTVTPQAYADGNYEIRAKSSCYNKDGSYATIYSPVLQGVMDRVNPSPFGTPSPGDGILDPNDDISIQFNEPIDISSLSYAPSSNPGSTFDIRGVLNGTAIRHSESLNFDGIADYAHVVGGASLQKRSFTFEFWAKFNSTGVEQTVISQGTDAVQKMSIGFDATNRLKFGLGNQTALSTNPIALPTDWHHYTVVYDYPNSDASLFVDGSLAGTNNNFIVDYVGSGKLAFGKALPGNNNFLNGNAHEVRLWSKARTISEITMTMNKTLSRNQSGLVYNWKMDEADGTVSHDDIRSRNADIYGATWEVNPNGNAVQLNSSSNDNIKVSSGNIAINKEMDFTLEFWFNSTQPGISTLFSNGEGIATTADSLDAWTIQKDATGKIHVYHKGLDFVASTTNYFNGNWHHFALVMQRTGNLSAYVDGNLQNSMQGINFNSLTGSYMYLGAKATVAGTSTALSDYYNGKLDEFRLWSTARKAEQIKRDKQNRMLGNEHGLLAYLPFENYIVVSGTPSLTPTFSNQSLTPSITVTAQNSPTLIAQTPTIKLPRPIQAVNYTWALNNDKIILSTNTSPDQLENVTLDITVKNALDMHGNKMQSPKTWIAYINKNQVKWQDDQFDFEKTVDSVITFVAPIVNSGGAQKAFTIDGLPSWMTANITSGTIAPNSVQNVTFTIPAGGTIGEYDAEVSVTTDFNFAEILRVNLKVKGVAPTWTVNPADFNYSMNVFGQLRIDNVIATNSENKIAAFSNGVICGVANLQYLPAYDRYEVFLNVYNNQITGDSIRFNIYDAASGLTFVNVTPSLMFVENDVVGTVINPITFVANTEIARDIPLNAGWTWVSFPLKSTKLLTSNSLMTSITPSNGDISTGISDYDQYGAGLGWMGNISQNGGYLNNQSYKIKKAIADTLIHVGMRLNPDSLQAQINVVPGWNWIGYVSNKNVSVSEALGNYSVVTGDLIKSQYEFAYYDNATGWTGSLTNMKPTLGYMLKSSGTSTFNYPLSTFIGKMASSENISGSGEKAYQNIFPFAPEQYSNTMSAIISGNICNDALDNGNFAVGAFDNTNTLRGFAYPTLTNNDYRFFLTLYSNTEGENLSIKYFNTTDGLVIPTNTVVSFSTDVLVGTPSAPFVANVNDSVACYVVEIATSVNEGANANTVSIYPNPFEDILTLTFNKVVNAKIELVDVLGKVIYASTIKDKKDFTLNLDRSKTGIAIGMYYIRLTGDVNKQIKIVKAK